MHGLSIGKLAKAAKVSIHTIRFYEKSGLLPAPLRRPSGYREYSAVDVLQLRLIREARLLGFSLEQIFELLALEDEANAEVIAAVVGRKLRAIDQRVLRLQQWRRALQELAEPSVAERSKRDFLLRFFPDAIGHAAAVHAGAEDSKQVIEDFHDEG